MAAGDQLRVLMEGDLNGVAISALPEVLEKLSYHNAMAHNAIYRGKNLGTAVTAAQYAEIAAGTFRDMYVGDYWVINGVTWRIAHFDYWYNTGDTACTKHHVVVMPDNNLYTAKMNETNTTVGGYYNSLMRAGKAADGDNPAQDPGLAQAKTIANAAFPNHVLTHRVLLTNAVTDGKPSGWAWYDGDVDLPTERMIYGGPAWGAHDGNGYNAGNNALQLALFRFTNWGSFARAWFWLQDVVSAAVFALADADGRARSSGAGGAVGVRPPVPVS